MVWNANGRIGTVYLSIDIENPDCIGQGTYEVPRNIRSFIKDKIMGIPALLRTMVNAHKAKTAKSGSGAARPQPAREARPQHGHPPTSRHTHAAPPQPDHGGALAGARAAAVAQKARALATEDVSNLFALAEEFSAEVHNSRAAGIARPTGGAWNRNFFTGMTTPQLYADQVGYEGDSGAGHGDHGRAASRNMAIPFLLQTRSAADQGKRPGQGGAKKQADGLMGLIHGRHGVTGSWRAPTAAAASSTPPCSWASRRRRRPSTRARWRRAPARAAGRWPRGARGG
jgi:hypothetical protein